MRERQARLLLEMMIIAQCVDRSNRDTLAISDINKIRSAAQISKDDNASITGELLFRKQQWNFL